MRKPDWLKVSIPSGENSSRVFGILARRGLNTVCDSARCPNKAECWGAATATFLVLGSVCTRGCRFCAVDRGPRGEPPRAEEPLQLSLAAAELGLRYVVLTSVDRDDLPDRGAAHFAACVAALKQKGFLVEALIPDYQADEIEPLLEAGPDALAHNIETVRRLQSLRDGRASWELSLSTLRLAAGRVPMLKSSIMLGLGERRDEVLAAMDELRASGCNGLVLGQYLRPTAAQVEVAEYIEPYVFDEYARLARERGFVSVVSSPLARTSYHARAAFEDGAL